MKKSYCVKRRLDSRESNLKFIEISARLEIYILFLLKIEQTPNPSVFWFFNMTLIHKLIQQKKSIYSISLLLATRFINVEPEFSHNNITLITFIGKILPLWDVVRILKIHITDYVYDRSCKVAVRGIWQNTFDDNSTLVSLCAIRLLRENHHASVVWNWYHWVAIAYLYQPSP